MAFGNLGSLMVTALCDLFRTRCLAVDVNATVKLQVRHRTMKSQKYNGTKKGSPVTI